MAVFFFIFDYMKRNLPDIYHIALHAAKSASEKIMEVYQEPFQTELKYDGSPVTLADVSSSKIIRDLLSKTNIPITDEESEETPFEIRKNWTESWCVDPLDGTKEFVKKNGEFVVNIAHIRGMESVFGIIAHPVSEQILLGGIEFGAYLIHFKDLDTPENWHALSPPSQLNSPLIMACSRSHHSGPVLQLIHEIKESVETIEFVKKGSALKFFDLAAGKADFYPRFAPTMEWDIAAGHAILKALGGEVTHATTGLPLQYNKANLLNPYFVAKTNKFHEKW